MTRVVLEHVYKYYSSEVPAVRDFNIEIADKEFVVLVGPSGCGKSTTLRMIAGLEDISEGSLFIGDRLVNDVPPKDRDIAMVFQNYALYPHMTVYDNLAFGLKLRKFSKQEIQNRVERASKILGIGELLQRKPKALSGGQQQRVAVGRAIVRNPQVFLFDEPLSNLDAKLRVQMRTEISKLHQKLQTTMIYVTHDQVEAMTMGDRIVVMKDGIIQQVDTPLNLYNKPQNKFVAGFIGSPSMNLLEGRIHQNGGLWFEEGGLKVKVPQKHESTLSRYVDKQVVFGIRPEDIHENDTPILLEEKATTQLSVEVIEPMGNESYLYATTGSNSIIARLGAELSTGSGEAIDLVINMSKAHFFEKDSEKFII